MIKKVFARYFLVFEVKIFFKVFSEIILFSLSHLFLSYWQIWKKSDYIFHDLFIHKQTRYFDEYYSVLNCRERVKYAGSVSVPKKSKWGGDNKMTISEYCGYTIKWGRLLIKWEEGIRFLKSLFNWKIY